MARGSMMPDDPVERLTDDDIRDRWAGASTSVMLNGFALAVRLPFL